MVCQLKTHFSYIIVHSFMSSGYQHQLTRTSSFRIRANRVHIFQECLWNPRRRHAFAAATFPISDPQSPNFVHFVVLLLSTIVQVARYTFTPPRENSCPVKAVCWTQAAAVLRTA